MKKYCSNLVSSLLIALFLLGSTLVLQAQRNNMGIGTTSPNVNAILDIESNTKGLLIPRLDQTQENGLSGPNGLLIYNSIQNRFNYYNGSWKPVGLWSINGANAFYSAGNVGIGTNNPTTAKLVIDAGSGNTGLDLASSNTIAEMRIIRNSLFGSDKNLHLGYGSPGGANTYLYSGGTTTTMSLTGGKVGIGTDTPASRLDVEGGMSVGASYSGTTAAPSNGAIFQGNVGIGTNDPGSFALSIRHGGNRPYTKGLKIQNYNAHDPASYWEFFHAEEPGESLLLYTNLGGRGIFAGVNGEYFNVSDRRLKDNIIPLSLVLPSLMLLEAKSYTFRSDQDNKVRIGFIAQDVEKIFPELISPPSKSDERENLYMMSYAGFGVIAVRAIQEQQEIIESQAKKIEAQQTEIDNIKRALAKAGIQLD